jgi:hypothetical protein
VPDDLSTLRARARAHQAVLDLELVYLTPQQLAQRWQVSVSTIHGMGRDVLPYMEHGNGTQQKRRRYHPLDVEAYEKRYRGSAA